MHFQNKIDVTWCVILLGLFPALHLPVLQAMLLIMIIALCLLFRQIDRSSFRELLTFPNIAIGQFLLFFLINALVFDVVEGSKPHFRAIAIESWSITFLCLVVLALWLRLQKAEDLKRALMRWLPVGLTASFLLGTAIYLLGIQGGRIVIFTPSSLAPPLWFLVFTMCSFAWFFEMSRWHKAWRLALLFMAGMMVIYGSARLVMLAWMLSGSILAVWLYLEAELQHRKKVLLGIVLCIALGVGGVVLADLASGGGLTFRMAKFLSVDFTYDSISAQFVRLKIWSGALAIIGDNVLLGIGQVNERFTLQQELEWKKWQYAHQSYLSYLIVGGIPALISGLVLQSPVLVFSSRAKQSTLLPAFVGLGVVVTMNCLTDSIFNSAVNVQVFMVATLVFLRASDADQPTLAPQKHVSSAII